MSKDIVSISKKANDVLLKITVPKRTGRKRKRGSQEPYQIHDGDAANAKEVGAGDAAATGRPQGLELDAKGILKRLKDNVGKYHVEAVGRIERTNVFRGQLLSSTMQTQY